MSKIKAVFEGITVGGKTLVKASSKGFWIIDHRFAEKSYGGSNE